MEHRGERPWAGPYRRSLISSCSRIFAAKRQQRCASSLSSSRRIST
jgi:hypothetical protein